MSTHDPYRSFAGWARQTLCVGAMPHREQSDDWNLGPVVVGSLLPFGKSQFVPVDTRYSFEVGPTVVTEVVLYASAHEECSRYFVTIPLPGLDFQNDLIDVAMAVRLANRRDWGEGATLYANRSDFALETMGPFPTWPLRATWRPNLSLQFGTRNEALACARKARGKRVDIDVDGYALSPSLRAALSCRKFWGPGWVWLGGSRFSTRQNRPGNAYDADDPRNRNFERWADLAASQRSESATGETMPSSMT